MGKEKSIRNVSNVFFGVEVVLSILCEAANSNKSHFQASDKTKKDEVSFLIFP